MGVLMVLAVEAEAALAQMVLVFQGLVAEVRELEQQQLVE
jgi:hypothetical protein